MVDTNSVPWHVKRSAADDTCLLDYNTDWAGRRPLRSLWLLSQYVLTVCSLQASFLDQQTKWTRYRLSTILKGYSRHSMSLPWWWAGQRMPAKCHKVLNFKFMKLQAKFSVGRRRRFPPSRFTIFPICINLSFPKGWNELCYDLYHNTSTPVSSTTHRHPNSSANMMPSAKAQDLLYLDMWILNSEVLKISKMRNVIIWVGILSGKLWRSKTVALPVPSQENPNHTKL